MGGLLPFVSVLLAVGAVPVETQLVQVAPVPLPGVAAPARSPGQARAVVLIQGLLLHPIDRSAGARVQLRSWQRPASVLVRALASEADVFAFCYGQTAAVTDIAAQPDLGDCARRLRQLGYTEVVLVGFSAGGLIARQFVEDNPEAGVVRVIQVCTPNDGASLAKVPGVVGSGQKAFLQSLTKQARAQALRQRLDRRIPEGVQFVCVVGTGMVAGDGVVSARSQWPEDLQRQGVPAFRLFAEHWEILNTERAARLIARLVRDGQPRWGPAQVAAMRKRLLVPVPLPGP
jgi:pimeloyl-ACP methyl ester carboxylesterase